MPAHPAWILTAGAALSRLAELARSARNLRRASGSGARAAEGRGAFAAMVATHVLLLVLPPLEASLRAVEPGAPALVGGAALFAGSAALRWWAIASLGPAWNVRVRVDPGLRVVAHGPYRWIRHPNYLAIVLEFAALPIAWGAWGSLLALGAANAVVLARRIEREERALRDVPGWQEAMGSKGRLLPRLRRRGS